MTMTDKSGEEAESTELAMAGAASSKTETDVEAERSVKKKHIWLPARSMLVLQGPARYEWAHGIAPRTMDKVDGQLIRRGRRVSFTIREAKYTLTADDIAYEEMQRQVAALGVDGGGARGGTLKLSADEEAAIMSSLQQEQEQGREQRGEGAGSLVASKVEEEHVFRVYDEIAQHWYDWQAD